MSLVYTEMSVIARAGDNHRLNQIIVELLTIDGYPAVATKTERKGQSISLLAAVAPLEYFGGLSALALMALDLSEEEFNVALHMLRTSGVASLVKARHGIAESTRAMMVSIMHAANQRIIESGIPDAAFTGEE